MCRVCRGAVHEPSSVTVSHTDKEDEPIGWSFGSWRVVDGDERHSRDDGAHKVHVEDGVDVDEVEGNGYCQELEARGGRGHVDGDFSTTRCR